MWASRLLLIAAFASSFLQYFFSLSMAVQIVPVALVLLSAYIGLLAKGPLRAGPLKSALMHPATLLITFAVPALTCIVAATAGKLEPTLFGLLLCATLIAVRILMTVMDLDELFGCVALASLIAMGALMASAGPELLQAIRSRVRFNVYSFHPNLLAFTLVGFMVSHLWASMRYPKARLLFAAAAAVAGVVIFYASSRGSIIGLLMGGVVLLACRWVRSLRSRRRLWRTAAGISLSGMAAAAGLFILHSVNPGAFEEVWDYTDQILRLSSVDRGFDSGLTGRVSNWSETIDSLDDGVWLYGNGWRSPSDEELGFAIDNGFLTLVYDCGIVAAAVIVGKFGYVLVLLLARFVRATDRDAARVWSTCLFGLTAFLTCNMVARYLLGVGNPFSLMGLVFLLILPQDGPVRVRA
jgi:hypothetical protein